MMLIQKRGTFLSSASRSYFSAPVALFFLLLFAGVQNLKAESASVTIAAACQQGALSGSQCPQPAPQCVDDRESSAETIIERGLGCQTVGEAFAGNERQCLNERNVPESARISASDLNNFVQQCDFIVRNPYRDIQNATCSAQAQSRDAQINNFFQDLAGRSFAQINCRLDTLNQYLVRPNDQDSAAKTRLNGVAREKFNQVRERLRGLIFSKQRAIAAAIAPAVRNSQYCYGMGCGPAARSINETTARVEANYEAAIAAEIAKIPWGYEPAVANAIFSMAQNGSFDEAQFEYALYETYMKYQNFGQYYADRARVQPGGGVLYCIDREFKSYATSTGVVDKLLDAYPPNVLSPTARDIVRCRLNSKYKAVDQNIENASNIAFMVGTGAAAILTAVPSGGGSLVAYGAVASAGLTVASFVDQVRRTHQECRKREFLISPTGAEQCNAAEDFEKEMSENSLRACLQQAGLAALEAVPILPEVAALARSTRAVRTVDEIPDAITEANRASRRGGEAQAQSGGRRSRGSSDETPAPARSRETADADAPRDRGSRRSSDTETAGPSTRGRSAASTGADEVRVAHIAADTPSGRLADRYSRDENVRLTRQQETEMARESYERKRELDQLIGGRNANDVNRENEILNRYLDRGENGIEDYIRMRGFGRARAQQLRETVRVLQRERLVLTRSRVNNDLQELTRSGAARVDNVPCSQVNRLNSTDAFHTGARCSVIRFTQAVENYCSCGSRGRLGSWAGPCAEAVDEYLLSGELADRDALPTSSAAGLQECKRIRINPGTVVIHGGLKPTMSGHGGAAQIFMPTRGLAPRGSDASRLDAQQGNLSTLRIQRGEITSAPEVEIIAVAPLHPSREVTGIFNAGRECRQAGQCTPEQVQDFVTRFDQYRARNPDGFPDEVLNQQREDFLQWSEWLRGCRTISPTRDSTYSELNTSIPGCRRP